MRFQPPAGFHYTISAGASATILPGSDGYASPSRLRRDSARHPHRLLPLARGRVLPIPRGHDRHPAETVRRPARVSRQGAQRRAGDVSRPHHSRGSERRADRDSGREGDLSKIRPAKKGDLMFRSRIVAVAALCALLLPAALMAQTTGDILPFKASEKTLPNGLKIIVIPTGFPNIVSIQIPVQTGSRNEVEPGKSGFAHFFEHMMFRGTKAYPPEKYQEILTKAGARQNAYTTDDYTNYHITFAKEDLETMLKIEADRFQNLSYPEASFKTEARAVLGEYNKNSANPINKLLEVQREHAFTAHTYKHTTMGFIRDIEDMPNQFEYSKSFFDRWYRPEYTTLIVAGDIDPEAVTAMVEQHWGAWKSGSAVPVTVPQEPAHGAPV